MFKLCEHGMAKSMIACLTHTKREHGAPAMLMTDGGTHFDNADVCRPILCGRTGFVKVLTAGY